MGVQKKKLRDAKRKRQQEASYRRHIPAANNVAVKQFTPKAPAHADLPNTNVHVFVDDQNIFWGIINKHSDYSYRIDFGKLLMAASDPDRFVEKAYIAGVIPDDDSFWKIAENKGFEVRRGYLGTDHRSKQDDAYLVMEITKTVCESSQPSTIVLIAGDADYVPPLQLAVEKGWRVEIIHVSSNNISSSLEPVCHKYREIPPVTIKFIEI